MTQKIIGAIAALAFVACLPLAAQQQAQRTQQPPRGQRPAMKPANIDARVAKWKAELGLNDSQVASIKTILESAGGPGMGRGAGGRGVQGDPANPRGGQRMGNPPTGGMPPGGMRGGMGGGMMVGGMMGGRADREIEAVLTEAQIPKFRALRKAEQVDQNLNQLTRQLALTPAQAAKIKPILAASIDKEASLMDVPEGENPDFEVIRALRERRDADISAVLTPEQKKIFEESRQGGFRRR
jgi:Spy/CpxP family protein refolding chaperone